MAQETAYREAQRRIQRAYRENATVLELSNMKLTKVPESIAKLSRLQRLYLDNNRLTQLPEAITQLSSLQEFYLFNNQLTTLPAAIASLSNLQILSLSNNHLKQLPEMIARLTNLEKLSLNNNQLTTLPAAIARLTNLEELSLNNNQLTDIPKTIVRLTNLSSLGLSNNQLKTLPEAIPQLTGLRTLYLANNQLTVLPETIAHLTNLQTLPLANNQIKTLPEAIAQLSKLESLSLDNNQLTKLPEAIAQLTNLRLLSLDSNQLTELSEAIVHLPQLQKLCLGNNRLTELPENIGKLTGLQRLVLKDNPLPIPAEIIRKGWGREVYEDGDPKIVIDYYLDYLIRGQQPLNEAKVILVGQGTVGKTSLVKRLCDQGFNEAEGKTDGIAISNLNLKLDPNTEEERDVRLNIWDFGGQEIMHATHQFFLTQRSLYILVLSNRNTEDENRLEYWLKTIESFGSDSPIIIVGNKCDEHPLDLNERELYHKYQNIKEIIPVSCKTNLNLKKLWDMIRREIQELPHVSDMLPKRWFEVKEHLEDLQENYIAYEEYVKICVNNKVRNYDKQKVLVGLLHDLGIVLNFHDDPYVNDTHVINPEWLTSGIYRIINYSELTTKYKGVLDYSLLENILSPKDYPVAKHHFIVEMMKKFELCLDLKAGETVLIPNLLPKSAPTSIKEEQWQDALRFEYHYPILSQSVISRFIVKMHHYNKNKIWWRTGVVLKDGVNQGTPNEALVKADLYDKKIFISINGASNTRRDFLAKIRSSFELIHQSFSEKSRPEEKIPLPNNPEVVVSYKHLLNLERKNIPEFLPDGADDLFSVSELLSSIKPTVSESENSGDRPSTLNIYTEKIENMDVDLSKTTQSGSFGVGVNEGTIAEGSNVSGQIK